MTLQSSLLECKLHTILSAWQILWTTAIANIRIMSPLVYEIQNRFLCFCPRHCNMLFCKCLKRCIILKRLLFNFLLIKFKKLRWHGNCTPVCIRIKFDILETRDAICKTKWSVCTAAWIKVNGMYDYMFKTAGIFYLRTCVHVLFSIKLLPIAATAIELGSSNNIVGVIMVGRAAIQSSPRPDIAVAKVICCNSSLKLLSSAPSRKLFLHSMYHVDQDLSSLLEISNRIVGTIHSVIVLINLEQWNMVFSRFCNSLCCRLAWLAASK